MAFKPGACDSAVCRTHNTETTHPRPPLPRDRLQRREQHPTLDVCNDPIQEGRANAVSSKPAGGSESGVGLIHVPSATTPIPVNDDDFAPRLQQAHSMRKEAILARKMREGLGNPHSVKRAVLAREGELLAVHCSEQ